MKRKFQFRVWDEESKKMYCGPEAIVTFSGFLEEVYIRNKNTVDELIDYKLMQWTGAKDSNNKDIYEGDILEIEDYFGENIIGKVLYDEKQACYWIMQGNERSHFMMTFDLESYVHTVIGNIYENPELLEDR